MTKRIEFSLSNSRLNHAEYAVMQDGERPIDAVCRSLERTTGYSARGKQRNSWQEDRDGNVIGETWRITLVERKAYHCGHAVMGETFVYL